MSQMFNRYRFDVRLWIWRLINPHQYQQHLSWLYALLKPYELLRDEFIDKTNDVAYQMAITGQVAYLEKYLSDFLNVAVTIEDAEKKAKIWLFNQSENRGTTYIYNASENQTPLYIYNKSEFGSEYDFVIELPNSLNGTVDLNLLRSMVKKYSAAGKRFDFEFV